jgi:hypothetical protein
MNALDLLVKTINEGFNTNPDKTVVDRFAFVLEEVIGSKQSYANKFFGNNPGILVCDIIFISFQANFVGQMIIGDGKRLLAADICFLIAPSSCRVMEGVGNMER